MTTTTRAAAARLPDPVLRAGETRQRRAAASGRSIVWMDVLRVGAILCVVAIHTVSGVTEGRLAPLLSGAWWVGATLDIASLWCVPVFVMISGALLLDPGRAEPARTFYRRRLRRIGVPLLFWTVFYLAFRNVVLGEHLGPVRAAHAVATGQPFLQLYFLYVILGLYLVTPVLRRVLRGCDDRQWALLAAAALAFAVVDATLHDLAHAGDVNAATRFIQWIGYYLAGGLLRRVPLPRRVVPAAVGAFLGAVAVTVLVSAALAAHYGWQQPTYYLFNYQSPTVVVMSLAVFLLGRALGERLALRPVPWFSAVARATFGVFLIHPILLLPYLRSAGLPGSAVGVAVAVPTITLVVCAVTTGVALAMERVPLVRRLV